jgi:hypothetical protein
MVVIVHDNHDSYAKGFFSILTYTTPSVPALLRWLKMLLPMGIAKKHRCATSLLYTHTLSLIGTR